MQSANEVWVTVVDLNVPGRWWSTEIGGFRVIFDFILLFSGADLIFFRSDDQMSCVFYAPYRGLQYMFQGQASRC
jgi:hypothetical protein